MIGGSIDKITQELGEEAGAARAQDPVRLQDQDSLRRERQGSALRIDTLQIHRGL